MASPDARAAAEPDALELVSFPVETIINIYSYLDIKHALRLARASKLLRKIYEANSVHILGPILSREFSPLDGLLRLIDVSEADSEAPYSLWSNRRARFAGLLVSTDAKFVSLPEIHFRQEHMPKVMRVVMAVSKWESAFPRLRFAELAEERRRLRPHEQQRLRGALYNLWRYAKSFHQHHDGHDVRLPWAISLEQGEVRAQSLRLLSTMELYELLDLWKTIRAAVTTQLCPSVSMLRRNEDDALSDVYLARRGWGDGLENAIIIDNVLRLSPDDLLDLLDFVADYPTASKEKLLSMIRLRHPTVHCACETLGHNLTRVIGERLHVFPEGLDESIAKFVTERNFPIPFGGILDDESAMEELRSQLSTDGGEGLTEGDQEEDNDGFSFGHDVDGVP